MLRPSLILVLLASAGCTATPSGGAWRTATPVNVAYRCQDGQTPIVRYFPDGRATIRLDDERAVDLAEAQGRYSGAGVTLTAASGQGAQLQVDGKATSCSEVDTD